MRKITYLITKEDIDLDLKSIILEKMDLSRNLYLKSKKMGAISIDSKPYKSYSKPIIGQLITISLEEEGNDYASTKGDLDIVFEDESILVINKDPYMVVHPTKSHQEDTLANIVKYYSESKGEKYKIRFVNRLDRDTSGLVIIAKNPHIHKIMSDLFKEDDFVKKYHLLVYGNFTKKEGIIDLPIAHKDLNSHCRVVDPIGKDSKTSYKVIKEYNEFSLVEARLHTGRTHQLRVHFSHLDHSIVGDELYGESSELIERQFLHSFYLEFKHPQNDVIMKLEANYKNDMIECLKKI
jgi:23S rRNA pseudouridine1911/1915/1917 synthase